jgi:hypothetical protein
MLAHCFNNTSLLYYRGIGLESRLDVSYCFRNVHQSLETYTETVLKKQPVTASSRILFTGSLRIALGVK